MIPDVYLESNPTGQSVRFHGTPINLTLLSHSVGLSPSHLSRIFSGKRTPSITAARKVSGALGMGLDEFLRKLEVKL